jgi:hypothetical protein
MFIIWVFGIKNVDKAKVSKNKNASTDSANVGVAKVCT